MNTLKFRFMKTAILILFTCALFDFAYGQGENKPIQLSGLVVEGDSLLSIPGAFVFVPETGRGTSTNLLGYFSFPVLPGDSVVVAAVGFKKESFIVPSDSESVSMVIHLVGDTMLLPLIEISAFPIESVFKEAFMTVILPDEGRENMNRNLNDQIMSRLLESSTMDGSLNHKYYMQQQITAMQTHYLIRTNPFLDPFSWARFFKSLSKEKERKEEERKQLLEAAPY